jgi:hypothetical protein
MSILKNLNQSYLPMRRWFYTITTTIILSLLLNTNHQTDQVPHVFIISGIFLLWASSICGIGSIILKSAGLLYSHANNFIIGLAASAVAIGVMLLLQSPQLITPFLWILFVLGSYSFVSTVKLPLLKRRASLLCLNLSGVTLPGAALIAYVILRYFQSLTPDMHPDALWYHLSGPLFWFNAGGFKFNLDAVQLAQASYWECLYIWPLYFFGSTPTSSLIAVHIFAQLTTVSVWLAASIVTAGLLKRIIAVGLSPQWNCLVILAALTTSELALSYPTPKNDWGVAALFIMGLTTLIQSQPALAGALLGITLVSKFSYAIPTAITLIVGVFYLDNIKRRGILLFSFALLAAPILLRNFIWTNNPLFPLFNSFFNSEYLPTVWQESLKSYNAGGFSFDFRKWGLIILSAFPLTQALTLLLLTPKIKIIAASYWSKRLTLITGASILLFASISGPRAELRLIGAIPVIVGAASIYALYLFRNSFIFRAIPSKVLPAITCCYLIIFSETPWSKIFQGYNLQNQDSLIYPEPYSILSQHQFNHDSKQRVLFAYDTRAFYFLNNNGIRVWDSLRLSELFENTAPSKIVVQIADQFRYFIVTNTVIDNFHRTEPIQQIQKLAKNHPGSIITDNNEGMLIDLFILRSHLMGTKE